MPAIMANPWGAWPRFMAKRIDNQQSKTHPVSCCWIENSILTQITISLANDFRRSEFTKVNVGLFTKIQNLIHTTSLPRPARAFGIDRCA